MAKTDKKTNDATATIKGTIYQFYVAVEKCFELVEGEKVRIEKDDDVSTQNQQIEVKQYESDLSDSHENIWKTLKNWLDSKFDHSGYKSLILLTTQSIGIKSTLANWNNKTTDEDLTVLKDIYSKAKVRDDKRKEKDKNTPQSDSYKLMNYVFSPENTEKLTSILEKFSIADSSLMALDYYERIKQVYCKGISPTNKDTYMNSLLGYVISPKVIDENSWEISYDDFTSQNALLTSMYCKETKIFPQKYTEASINQKDKEEVTKHLFVKKIEDIEYHEVIPSAISDFIRTRE